MSRLLQKLMKDDRCDLDFLKGKTIKDIGFVSGVEGGLAIDYMNKGIDYRVILGFTELGMWVEHRGRQGSGK